MVNRQHEMGTRHHLELPALYYAGRSVRVVLVGIIRSAECSHRETQGLVYELVSTEQ